MNEPSVLIPISEYEKLKKAYEEFNNSYYGKVVSIAKFNYYTNTHEREFDKIYYCKEDIFKDFDKDNEELHEIIQSQSEQLSELKGLKEKIEKAPTFLGYKYFKK
jgi:hypothetical protein